MVQPQGRKEPGGVETYKHFPENIIFEYKTFSMAEELPVSNTNSLTKWMLYFTFMSLQKKVLLTYNSEHI